MRNALLLAALALTAGCSTYYEHRFAPAPVEVELAVDGEPQSQARALVTVHGIRRPADGRGAVVEARLRLENLGADPVELVAETLVLLSADLQEMGSARIEPRPEPIAQGGTGTYAIEFELPAGRTPQDYDLQGMNLKWEVDFGVRRVLTGITFERSFAARTSRSHVSLGVGYYR